jgi:hypothetical protein
MSEVSKAFTVVRDTREKVGEGWLFDGRVRGCRGTVELKLDTGDYTIKGLERKLCIERKGAVTEWATNVFEDRFRDELVRMKSIEHSFIICEFTLQQVAEYPKGSGLPFYLHRKIKVRGPLLLKKTIELQLEYPNVQFVFAGAAGRSYAISLLKREVDFFSK